MVMMVMMMMMMTIMTMQVVSGVNGDPFAGPEEAPYRIVVILYGFWNL